MKIVISPAKSLDLKSEIPTNDFTIPVFIDKTEILNTKMANKSKNAIKELMSISDNLAELNYQRYQDFSVPFSNKNARQAVYSFSGDVYGGIDAYSLTEEKIVLMQKQLRILSGLYGILKPLDLMQAYRLEMGTPLKINRNKNLYEFWGRTITDHLNEELENDELLVNLASQEYFKAVQPKQLKVAVISPIFKDFKNGKLKIISFFAKKARGMMVRHLVDIDAKTIEDIKAFNSDGYSYSADETADPLKPVFTR
jgi:cytoplasmic iron level regulating protein YaaA (DUF328/UPF0246 family)